MPNAKYEIFAKEDILDPSNDGKVIYKKGTIVDTITTDSTGKATSKDLPLGRYSVKECVAPQNFVLNTEVKDVILEYKDQNTAIVFDNTTFTNERQKVELYVYKKDAETDVLLSGAEFGLYAKNEILNYNGEVIVEAGQLIEIAVSTDEGKMQFKSDLPLTNFEIKELKAPIGYSSSNEIINVDATYKGQDINVINLNYDFKNKITKVQFSKQDITNAQEIEGAHLTVFEKNNESVVVDTWISGSDGKNEDGTIKPHLIKGMEVGKTYILRETSSPYGFAISEDVEFTIKDTWEIQTVEMKDKIVFGIFARKDIIDYMGNVAIKKGTMISTTGITEEGLLENVPDLPCGKYFIKELSTNKQYILNDNEYDFEISYVGENIIEYIVQIGNEGIIDNKLARGTIKVQKIDTFDENKKLENVEFSISTNPDMSNPISTEKTNVDGVATFSGLELGIYYIQEKQVDGYALNDTIYKVEVTKNGDLLTIACENKPTEMVFSKVDETGVKELPGATIQIIDVETGDIVEELVSTEESHIVRYLVEGKEYIMKEFTAPYGYEIAEEITFIAGDGLKVTMKNMPILTDIQIIKIDSETKEIIKAEFSFGIYEDEECTKLIREVKSNIQEGTILFEDLRYGKFFIKELSEPNGYTLSNEIVKLEINDKGVFVNEVQLEEKDSMYSFYYDNTAIPKIQTGNEMNYVLVIGSMVISLFGIITGIIILRKNKQKNNKN